ncbi:MAG TPA: hypothetical protein VFN13_03260, partial [Rudaea sp.]|nr:hypothetical protein [Rudaea sp.]
SARCASYAQRERNFGRRVSTVPGCRNLSTPAKEASVFAFSGHGIVLHDLHSQGRDMFSFFRKAAAIFFFPARRGALFLRFPRKAGASFPSFPRKAGASFPSFPRKAGGILSFLPPQGGEHPFFPSPARRRKVPKAKGGALLIWFGWLRC